MLASARWVRADGRSRTLKGFAALTSTDTVGYNRPDRSLKNPSGFLRGQTRRDSKAAGGKTTAAAQGDQQTRSRRLLLQKLNSFHTWVGQHRGHILLKSPWFRCTHTHTHACTQVLRALRQGDGESHHSATHGPLKHICSSCSSHCNHETTPTRDAKRCHHVHEHHILLFLPPADAVTIQLKSVNWLWERIVVDLFLLF